MKVKFVFGVRLSNSASVQTEGTGASVAIADGIRCCHIGKAKVDIRCLSLQFSQRSDSRGWRLGGHRDGIRCCHLGKAIGDVRAVRLSNTASVQTTGAGASVTIVDGIRCNHIGKAIGDVRCPSLQFSQRSDGRSWRLVGHRGWQSVLSYWQSHK